MKDLSDYTIAIIASHNVMYFLNQLFNSIKDNNIKYHRIVVGDAGLENDEKEWVAGFLPNVEIHRLENRVYLDGVKTQDMNYRSIIDNRIPFLRELFLDPKIKKVLQLDADTAIVSNDFSLLEDNKDLILCVRDVTPDDHILNIYENGYPNCGVIFWENLPVCLHFLLVWENMKTNNSQLLHPGQYEQSFFYHSMKTKFFDNMNVQKIHCRYYNCYDPEWINKNTSILHYKGHHVPNPTPQSRSDRLNIRYSIMKESGEL